MTLYFTADYHFGHERILGYCNRPFKSLKEMNDALIKNHNERVGKDDTVIFLGDFCFKAPNHKKREGSNTKEQEYIKKLNGNIVFVKGNHDSPNLTHIQNLTVKLGGREMFCCHDPKDYNPAFPINLVGHTHEKWKTNRTEKGTLLINVGVDVWNYKPIKWSDIEKVINKEEGKGEYVWNKYLLCEDGDLPTAARELKYAFLRKHKEELYGKGKLG